MVDLTSDVVFSSCHNHYDLEHDLELSPTGDDFEPVGGLSLIHI